MTSRITDFDDALKSGPPGGTTFHNRGNAFRAKADRISDNVEIPSRRSLVRLQPEPD
jgi:hypothetical protein